MFGRKKDNHLTYDKENETPAVKSSICTGEKTAGFIDNSTGKYRDVMLIRSEADIAEFKRQCGVEEIKTIY